MSEVVAYLDATKLALISSPAIADFAIIRERVTATDGYVRLRATLINGDFLELTEYFIRIGQSITTVDYRYQWMDADKAELRRRWDNTPHHPEIASFPHHSHLEGESKVVSSHLMSIIELLPVLESLVL